LHSGRSKIDASLRFAGQGVLNFLLPLRCICCDQRVGSEGSLCARCWRDVPFIEKPWCHRLGTPFSYDVGDEAWSPAAIAAPPEFDRLRSVAFYDGPARSLVLALKFSGRRELARSMGSWMSRSGGEFLHKDSLIVPVPLHWFRLLSRRFNQAADLAKAVSLECGGQYEPQLLKRTKRTRQQVGLSAKDRRTNVRSAFAVDKKCLGDLQGRHIVLIDDVLTTGATIAACSKVLLKAGAASVDVLTFAHADPSKRSDSEWLTC
jgi:ComF family protein